MVACLSLPSNVEAGRKVRRVRVSTPNRLAVKRSVRRRTPVRSALRIVRTYHPAFIIARRILNK